MPVPIKVNEATAGKRVAVFPLIRQAADTVAPATGEEGGQPQIAYNDGTDYTNTDGTLIHLGNGSYQVQLTQAETNKTAGTTFLLRYKSANTIEERSYHYCTVSYDPYTIGADLDTLIDTVDSVVDNIYVDTQRVDALVENSTGDRFTAKALEAAPAGEGSEVNTWLETIYNDWSTLTTNITTIINNTTGSGTGVGSRNVTITLQDETTAAVPWAWIYVRNSAGNATVAQSILDQNGQRLVLLDDGTYKVYFGGRVNYAFSNPYTLTVSGDTATTFSCTTTTGVEGGMTFAQLKEEVWRPLRNEYGDNFRDANLSKWINLAVLEVDGRLRWTRGYTTFTSVSGTQEYTVPQTWREILNVRYDTELVQFARIEEVNEEDTTGSGDPTKFCIFNNKMVFWPVPDTTGDTIKVWFVGQAPLLVDDTDVPAVPPDYHQAIVDYARFLGFSGVNKINEGAAYLKMYEMRMQAAEDKPVQQHGADFRMKVVPE